VRYRLVEKFWSLFGDAFAVRDQDGREMYSVRRRKSDDGERIAFEDLGELEVASVRSLPPSRWLLTCGGAEVARVTREALSALRWRLVVDAPGLDQEIRREGGRYAITAGGTELASVRLSSSLFTNSFAVEVTPDIDPLLALSVAVVIALTDRS
jgi:uncharacterized protein YxjI